MRSDLSRRKGRRGRLVTWLTLRLLLAMSLWIVTGCTVVVQPAKPPLYLAPPTRPALIDEQQNFTRDGQAWLQKLVNAYLHNCITLKVLRGEDPTTCDAGLR